MAIKKNGNDKQVPEKLDKMLFTAFSFQQLRDQFDGEFKAVKENVVAYLDSNTDNFDVNISEGFKTNYGTVIYSSRSNNDVNVDKLEQLVASGKVTLIDILKISKPSVKELEKLLGAAQFKEVVTALDPTLSLTFRASSEFKDECQGKFNSIVSAGASIAEPEEFKEPVKEAPKKNEKAEKAKALSKKAMPKSSLKTAAEDLADILGEK